LALCAKKETCFSFLAHSLHTPVTISLEVVMLQSPQIRAFFKVCKLSGLLVVAAQLLACGSTVESGGGSMNSGGSGGTGGTGGTAGSGGSVLNPCECLAAYASDSLGEEELRRLRDEGIAACFHKDDPVTLDAERACLPASVGQHEGDGRAIEVYYFCSDLCPDYGRVGVRYVGVSDTPSCCAIGGIPLRDPAWGGFEACVPSEIHPIVSWVDTCP
jgi:hypothetical protein